MNRCQDKTAELLPLGTKCNGDRTAYPADCCGFGTVGDWGRTPDALGQRDTVPSKSDRDVTLVVDDTGILVRRDQQRRTLHPVAAFVRFHSEGDIVVPIRLFPDVRGCIGILTHPCHGMHHQRISRKFIPDENVPGTAFRPAEQPLPILLEDFPGGFYLGVPWRGRWIESKNVERVFTEVDPVLTTSFIGFPRKPVILSLWSFSFYLSF